MLSYKIETGSELVTAIVSVRFSVDTVSSFYLLASTDVGQIVVLDETNRGKHRFLCQAHSSYILNFVTNDSNSLLFTTGKGTISFFTLRWNDQDLVHWSARELSK
jgi:hypothetical protein